MTLTPSRRNEIQHPKPPSYIIVRFGVLGCKALVTTWPGLPGGFGSMFLAFGFRVKVSGLRIEREKIGLGKCSDCIVSIGSHCC